MEQIVTQVGTFICNVMLVRLHSCCNIADCTSLHIICCTPPLSDCICLRCKVQPTLHAWLQALLRKDCGLEVAVGPPQLVTSAYWTLRGASAFVAGKLGTTVTHVLQQHSMLHMTKVPTSYTTLSISACAHLVAGLPVYASRHHISIQTEIHQKPPCT